MEKNQHKKPENSSVVNRYFSVFSSHKAGSTCFFYVRWIFMRTKVQLFNIFFKGNIVESSSLQQPLEKNQDEHDRSEQTIILSIDCCHSTGSELNSAKGMHFSIFRQFFLFFYITTI